MNLQVRYYDRDKKETVTLDIPADVVSVHIPEQKAYNGQPDWHLPALVVNVNTDAVILDVDANGGKEDRVTMHEYSDLLAESHPHLLKS